MTYAMRKSLIQRDFAKNSTRSVKSSKVWVVYEIDV